MSVLRLALCLLCLGCTAERPAWFGGELVPPPELRPAVSEAAAFWNRETGSEWAIAEACGGPTCVRFDRAPCPTGADSCTAWHSTPLDEWQRISVRPGAPIEHPMFGLLMAHELGHVMGYDHDSSKPNVMATGEPAESSLAWVIP